MTTNWTVNWMRPSGYEEQIVRFLRDLIAIPAESWQRG